MKKSVSLLLTLLVISMNIATAFAINEERFINEPGNAAMKGSIIYGMDDMISRTGKDPGGLMMMLYSSVAIEGKDYPVLVMLFGADTFIASSAVVETDQKIYTIMDIGDIGKMGLTKINNMANILTTKDAIEVYRAITESDNVTITLIGNGRKYNFKLTDEQRHQLSLVVAEFDEEIAKYLDPDNTEYNNQLAKAYEKAAPSIAVSKK